MKKLIGLVAVLAVLGALAAPFASAEEGISQTPPEAPEESEPAAPESEDILCGGICVFAFPYFMGADGVTSCGAPGAHPLAGWKYSIINECSQVAVWARVNGNAIFCKEPMTSNNNSPAFNELWVGKGGSHC